MIEATAADNPNPAPAVMLARSWDHRDPTGWWISEKLDGVRAIWTGTELLTRNGNRIAAPAWFVAGLPAGFALDGELWGGRGRFQEAVGVVRLGVPDERWAGIRFRTFDAPTAAGGFEARQESLVRRLRGSDASIVAVVRQTRCDGPEHLERIFAGIVAAGGEGGSPASAGLGL